MSKQDIEVSNSFKSIIQNSNDNQ